ncbi:hypothetical protein BDR06DRAFT_1070677 [Suillus hirtellus]|nr:hypothetical protein BDR06DRAFT_1070677 [Suillus hirtellus]
MRSIRSPIGSPASDSERLERQVSQTIILPLHFLILAQSDCSSQDRELTIILVSCLQNYTINLKEIAVLQRWSSDAKIVDTEKRQLNVLVRPESRNLDRMERQHAQEITGYEDGVALLRCHNTHFRRPSTWIQQNMCRAERNWPPGVSASESRQALVPKALSGVVQYLAHCSRIRPS